MKPLYPDHKPKRLGVFRKGVYHPLTARQDRTVRLIGTVTCVVFWSCALTAIAVGFILWISGRWE